jgi:hypothetical protein
MHGRLNAFSEAFQERHEVRKRAKAGCGIHTIAAA